METNMEDVRKRWQKPGSSEPHRISSQETFGKQNSVGFGSLHLQLSLIASSKDFLNANADPAITGSEATTNNVDDTPRGLTASCPALGISSSGFMFTA